MGTRQRLTAVLVVMLGAVTACAQATQPTAPPIAATGADTGSPESAAAGAQPAVLMLEAQEPGEGQGYARGLLVRELVRQAVLIAGRDELGLATRDQALREPFVKPAVAPLGAVAIETGALGWEYYRSSLTRQVNGAVGRLRLPDLPFAGAEARVNWMGMIEGAEAASRGKMAEQLRAIGFTGAGRTWGQAAVPQEAQRLLNEIDFLSQYLAVRRLHAELAAGGDSEPLLGGLVRGYAHLGVLTDYFWNATHKVYKARALLYAQRMVAHDPRSPAALWHRAYALALSGLPGSAEQDLERARTLAAEGGSAPAEPPWVNMLDAFCRYDWRRLQGEEWPVELRPLGALLALLSVETHAGERLTTQAAELLAQRAPPCMRALDKLCSLGGVSLGHTVTMSGPEALAAMLAERLPELDLTGAARDRLPRGREAYRRAANRRQAAMVLVDAGAEGGQAGEPSWAALGRMIEEINFVQIASRLHFMDVIWGVDQTDVGDFAQHVAAAARDHPLANYLESYAFAPGQDEARLRQLFDSLRPADVGFGIAAVLRRANRCNMDGREAVQEIRSAMFRHKDQIVAEVSLLVDDWDDPQWKLWYARLLADIAPHSPHATATFIELEWDKAQERLPDWEREHAWQPAVIRALVPKLRENGQQERAVKLLERYISVAPAPWPFEQLAEIYLERGDEGMWLTTMERRLKYADFGLEHARTRVDIARHFMRKGDFARAMPYAEAAAETWAAWAMQVAAICGEGLGDWERAEMWVRRISQRYAGSRWDWYLWCLRTGWGDAAAAEALIEALVLRLHQPGMREVTVDGFSERLGWQDLFNGHTSDAIEHFRRSYRRLGDFWPGVVAMMLANHEGDAALRDDLRVRLLETARERKDSTAIKLLGIVGQSWTQKAPRVDVAELDSLAAEIDTPSRLMVRAAAAQVLFDLRQPDEARQMLVKVLREPELTERGYLWAWALAREQGLDPVELRGWPAPRDRHVWQKPAEEAEEPGAGEEPAEPQAAPTGPPPAPI